MAKKTKISPVHKAVIFVGFPAMAIFGVLYAYVGSRALDLPPTGGQRDGRQLALLIAWTIGGNHVVDAGMLSVARALLVATVVAMVLSVAVALWETGRIQKRDNRGIELIDEKNVLMDIPFWQVGDRGGWKDKGVHIGTVVEVHRRPFVFEGRPIDAFSGGPSMVMQEDGTGIRAVPPALLYRLAGSSGPSGTLTSIHDDMVNAVQVGDETSWIDPKGEVQEGTIVEIKHKRFQVAGKRVDASEKNPGYVIARTPDGVHVGVSSNLREGV